MAEFGKRQLSTRDKNLLKKFELSEKEQVADMMNSQRSIDELLKELSRTKNPVVKSALEDELLNIQQRVEQSLSSSVTQKSAEPESVLQNLFNSITSIFTK